MNKDKVAGGFDQVKGEAKEQWGKVTEDHSTETDGKFDKVKGKVKEGIGEIKEKLSEDK
ncbi:CsbD family protein [Neobacillus vireti]|uniref:CsbD family protein n=1 Tax=Neobacillus vireti TaxID=220686 RepID=UPI002FFF77A7